MPVAYHVIFNRPKGVCIMAKAKGIKKAVEVALVPSKRAQVLAFIAFAKANDIPVNLLPGIMFAYSTVMRRRHATGEIKNGLGECQRYPANALKGRHSCIGDDYKAAMVWVRGLKITKATATTAQAEYVKARTTNKAKLAAENAKASK
jgi:hypothetical protein